MVVGDGGALSEDGIVNIKGEKKMTVMRWRELFDAYLVAQ